LSLYGTRGPCLRRVRTGSKVTPFVGLRSLVSPAPAGEKVSVSCDGSNVNEKVDKLHVVKAEGAFGMP